MIDHQHSVLRTLGIDLWIPRETVCVQVATTSLWRDQAAPEQHSHTTLADITPTVIPRQNPEQKIALTRSEASAQVSLKSMPAVVVPAVLPQQNQNIQTALEPILMDEGVCPAFQLQALTVSQCTLVVESTHFNEQQWVLWHNLQQAVFAKNSRLEWPFPLQHMQDARGALCYIQGFLDATGVDQQILILGELPYIAMQSKWEKMPSIQQLLEQPLLKKQLWQRLYTE